ncbi:MAG: hypothetical protein COV37_06040 [Bdellovibrio sp. CG11_big_fil_rev_8_21_14_0_20_39_38]|nr:MAG: hypothetical protein COV37_06040 [Bdellovibrio sp. CG11_big_fil_rev_8_21_14_0_20_39_38]
MKVISSLIALIFLSDSALATEFNYKHSSEMSSSDYLFKERSKENDSVFDNYQTVDLGFSLGVGADCGKVDFKSTLQTSLKNLLDAKYFESVGNNILAASPMLLTCYLSPTWCSILKHTRVNANFLSQMRLDQCALIDKYVDNRSEDFKKERQDCVHQAIQRNGGNMEQAMKECQSSSNYSVDLANWAGSHFGSKAGKNKLIESSAKWAGFNSSEAKKSVGLLKALVGDTVIGKGRISVEYGPKNRAITPRTRLYELEKDTYEKLCKGLLKKIDRNANRISIDRLIGKEELNEIGGNKEDTYIDKQTLRYLSYLPFIKRGSYCRKLAASVAMTKFSDEMNSSLDMLNILEQNPNLPETRKLELAKKRKNLKDSIEATLQLQEAKNTPLNTVVSQITSEGRFYQGKATERAFDNESSRINSRRSRSELFDCADGILCDQGGN